MASPTPQKAGPNAESILGYRAPAANQSQIIDSIKERSVELYDQISLLPEGRYRSLALTHLEECQMWAAKAVTHGDVFAGRGREGSA